MVVLKVVSSMALGIALLGTAIATSVPEQVVSYLVAGAAVFATVALVAALRTSGQLRAHIRDTGTAAQEAKRAVGEIRRVAKRE